MNAMDEKKNSRYRHLQGALWGWLLATMTLCCVSGCNCRQEAVQETQQLSPTSETDSASEVLAPRTMTAFMRVVTLEGLPLSGMIPIATLQPNAFDRPIATGVKTNADGQSRIRFTTDQKVALRAWDPDLRYFPNNFYEVLPQIGEVDEMLVISMVEAATIEAVLFQPDGRPVANENTGIMLFHPVHGPWWPAEADADEKGAVTFAKVPPGQYVLRLKVASGAAVEIPETYLAPGKSAHLGLLYLQ